MFIFHGSCQVIKNPIYKGGKPYNDYGYGFYCTEDPDMAREWSVDAERNGYVNKYELAIEKLKILNLEEYGLLSWLAVLLENRTFDVSTPLAREGKKYIIREFLPEYEQYDVICGYRADDSYFSFAQDFINGVISYDQLNRAMHLGRLGKQVVIKSKDAFDVIRWVDAVEVSSEEWFPRKAARDSKARQEYADMNKEQYIRGALYITRILDEEIKRNDARLQ